MPLFGSRKKQFEDITDANELHVTLREDSDGYILVSANEVIYGKIKPGGDMIINEAILEKSDLLAEALLVFTGVASGERSEITIAKLIIEFRQYQRKT